jgi:Na+-transporting methylmalonyl-CoA/oxaloacetate decarboxylase gamma subunit
MATGDQGDIESRIESYLPRGWFGDLIEAPIIGALISGMASVFAVMYLLIMFFWAQTRLDTSSGGWVDIWASDFLGNSLPRKSGESDASYIARIKIAIFQKRATRPAMMSVLTQLTGNAPIIFEPARPLDSGCLGANTGVNSFCGVARMGSLACPFGALITVFRPQVSGGSAGAAYSNAPRWSAMGAPLSHGYTGSLAAEKTAASDDDIYAAINATRPIATNIGVCITNIGATPALLGATFVLGESILQ